MSTRPINALLIEDNPGDARLIRDLLAESGGPGFHLEWADSLSSGLERLANNGIDVVLLDLSLPESFGLHTFVKTYTQAPDVPIVVLAGLDDETVAVEALRLGAQDYLVKGEAGGNLLVHSMRHAIGRHRLQRELDQTRQQKLEIKNQFLSHVSHELRSPLTAIYQFVTILLDGLAGDLSPEQREYLEIGLRNVNRLRNMIDELLEATRTETGKLIVEPRPISAAEPIAETLDTFRESAEAKAIALSADLPENLPPVYADPERVRQILSNLVDNAIKFTPEHGTVMIRAGVYEDPGFLCVSVADTGCGISPEGVEMIFEQFYQEASSQEGHRKGLGLGLYISKELVSHHGGRIWVESQLGVGSTFSFLLPVFSLEKLLHPIITENDRLRDSVALITIKLRPGSGSSSRKIGEVIHRQAREMLQRCIRPDLDMVLPRMASAGEGEIFLVVACTDSRGAEVVVRRIREQIGREFQAFDIHLTVSATMVETPSQRENRPLEQLVEDVVTRIGALTKAAQSEGGDRHGQTENSDRG